MYDADLMVNPTSSSDARNISSRRSDRSMYQVVNLQLMESYSVLCVVCTWVFYSEIHLLKSLSCFVIPENFWYSKMFTVTRYVKTRGHQWKLYPTHCYTNVRKHFFWKWSSKSQSRSIFHDKFHPRCKVSLSRSEKTPNRPLGNLNTGLAISLLAILPITRRSWTLNYEQIKKRHRTYVLFKPVYVISAQ